MNRPQRAGDLGYIPHPYSQLDLDRETLLDAAEIVERRMRRGLLRWLVASTLRAGAAILLRQQP